MWGRKSRRIVELDRQLARALGIITEKNDALRDCLDANERLHERNERLHRDMAAMRERLPKYATGGVIADRRPFVREGDERIVRVDFTGILADPDPTRPYIPTYEAGKDEKR